MFFNVITGGALVIGLILLEFSLVRISRKISGADKRTEEDANLEDLEQEKYLAKWKKQHKF